MFDWIAQQMRSRNQDPITGVMNFGVVEAEAVLRGACPDDDELIALVRLRHVRTILDLRAEVPGRTLPFDLVNTDVVTYRHAALDDKAKEIDVARVEECAEIVADPKNYPLFIHCAGGRHRTGAVVALYRVHYCHWDPDAAYEEARERGLYSEWGHGAWVRYIKHL